MDREDTDQMQGSGVAAEVDGPTFTVVLNTYNRASLLPRAIGSVIAQTYKDFELVVSDDGSTDDTPNVVAAITDPRIRFVRQENAGLSAARNLGAQAARGRFIAFLDDDDEVSPDWLASFAAAATDPRSGFVCCGVEYLDEGGALTRVELPRDLGPAYDHCVGLFLPGAFAVRRELFFEAGGFTVGLPCNHQTELAFRLIPCSAALGLRSVAVAKPLLRMHRAQASRRPRNDPERLWRCTTFILERHGDRLARSPKLLANYFAIAGVSAARMGSYDLARRYLARSVRSNPMSARGLGRLLVSGCKPLARRVWAVSPAASSTSQSSR